MIFTHVDPPNLPALTRQDSISGKRTYLTPEGNKYPSVTTLLGSGPKPWLEAWKNALGHDKAAAEVKRAGDRGTAVHKLIEGYLNNDPDYLGGFKPEYVKSFNQLKFYLNRIKNIRTQEIALYSDELKIAGTVDCIGEYAGKLCIIDFKTSTNMKTSSMVGDYRLQCTAYALCFFEQTGIFIEDYAILMAVEKGIVPLVFSGKVKNHIKELKDRVTAYYAAHPS